MSEYICIGMPYFIGQRVEGRAEVEKIKASGFAEDIGAKWVDIAPAFSADIDPNIVVNRALADVIAQNPNKKYIVFASDCVAALGVVKGLEAKQPAVIWYDAHGDFNTDETTPSGFLGGMPLAMLTGRGNMQYMNGVGTPRVADSDVIITDARDLDPEEATMLAESDLIHLPQVDDLMTVSLPSKPLYIHFDTDVVRLDDMPGMSYPAEGGPSLETCIKTLQRVVRDSDTAALLFSLWNDTLPTDGKSLDSTLQIARAFVEADA